MAQHVTIPSDICLPSRSECIVPAKVPKSYAGMLGMVCNLNEGSELSCFTAYSIGLANVHKVPVRVLNTSLADIQFHARQKIARFWPVIESISPNSPMQSTCAGVLDKCQIQAQTLAELRSALSPTLSAVERNQVLDTLLSFPDVFNNELDYTSVLSHHIDTGDTTPIKQHPRRLPYHYRSEVKQQVADMLEKGIIQSSTSPWASPVAVAKLALTSWSCKTHCARANMIPHAQCTPVQRV